MRTTLAQLGCAAICSLLMASARADARQPSDVATTGAHRATVHVNTVSVGDDSKRLGQEDRWRFVFHDNRWWYYLSGGQWMWWDGSQWTTYTPAMFPRRYATTEQANHRYAHSPEFTYRSFSQADNMADTHLHVYPSRD